LKFFFKNRTIFITKKNTKKHIFICGLHYANTGNIRLKHFTKFILNNGALIKGKKLISNILLNFNLFFYNNYNYVFDMYPTIKWLIIDLVEKKLDSSYVFDKIIDLIKPPFIVTSLKVPKKLRKKIKKKYLTKIVYKSEIKRIRNSYKQLYYFSKKFTDTNFKVRLYKALMFSFLDGKNSELFKLKLSIFKNFFRF
jgi:hypothetical protein